MAEPEYDLMGLAEMAEFLGKSKQATCNMKRRQKLPKPIVELAQGPVWNKPDVLRYFGREP